MPKCLPAVGASFARETRRSLDVVTATEILWQTAPPASAVRKQLKVAQLEALYESVYLRLFASWENALERLVVYYLAGYRSKSYAPERVARGHSTTLKDARRALYGGSDFLLWHNPDKVIDRVRGVLVDCPVERVLANETAEIRRYAAVRHRIAHASEDATERFKDASLKICGYEHENVGHFLRSANSEDPLNPRKQILEIQLRLVRLVSDMAA